MLDTPAAPLPEHSHVRRVRYPPTKYARNLLRLMQEKGWTATRLSRAAGLGRTYVSEILSGRILSPGSEAVQKLAAQLDVDQTAITHDGESEPPAPPDAERRILNRARALRAAEKAFMTDVEPIDTQTVLSVTHMIYDVVMECEASRGRPIDDNDEEFWRTIDTMARRWSAESR
jgi:transcriptional regulator with XRE-family HTH domain